MRTIISLFSTLAMLSTAGCSGNSSVITLGDDTAPSPCYTDYYDPELGVGFDPPSSFEGPFAGQFGDLVWIVSNPATTDERFTELTLDSLALYASGLQDTVETYIAIKSESAELLAVEPFTASNSQPGFILRWLWLGATPQQVADEVEGWVAGESESYVLTAWAFRDDFVNKAVLLETAVRSICSDQE